MKSVLLEGVLGEKFGREWSLDVLSPAEAVRAIDANRPGFMKYLAESTEDQVGYRIMLDDEDIEPERLVGPFSSREVFRIVPVMSGAEGEAKMIIGAIIIVAAVVLSYGAAAPAAGAAGGTAAGAGGLGASIVGGFTYANLAMLGASMVLGGISMALASQPKAGGGGEKGEGSSVFNGPVNTVTQGGPVPIGYGRLMVGSILISGSIKVDEVRVATGRGDDLTGGQGDVRFIPE